MSQFYEEESPFAALVRLELERVRSIRPRIHSILEGFDLIMEEADGFKSKFWGRDDRHPDKLLEKLVKVVVACERTARDCGLIG